MAEIVMDWTADAFAGVANRVSGASSHRRRPRALMHPYRCNGRHPDARAAPRIAVDGAMALL